jgi:hypothetical protein
VAPSLPDVPGLSDVEHELLGIVLTQNAGLVAGAVGAPAGAARPPALEALAAARSAGIVLDYIVRILVGRARAEGRSWAAVGDALHVSRQAAFQKFGGDDDADEGMTEIPDGALPDAAGLAGGVIADFAAARWTPMRAGFTPRMQEACSAALLTSVRATLAAELGSLLTTRRPQVTVRGRYTVVDVPLVYERGIRKGRVTLTGAGQVAGFFVLIPEAP